VRLAPAVAALALLAPAAELHELPNPPLGSLEPAVREQLGEARSAVERLMTEDRARGAELGAALGSLGELYLLYDLADAAERCLASAAELAPGEHRWPYLLGVVHQAEHELDRAEAAFRAALAVEPADVPALLRLGEVLLAGARAPEAREVFARALDVDPRSAAAHAGWGRAALAENEPTKAIEAFEAALALQPQASSLHYRIALAERALGDEARARRELERSGAAPVTFPDPVLDAAHRRVTGVGALLLVAQIAARAGAFDTAEDRLRDALALDARSAEAHRALGTFLEERGRTAEAIGHYLDALRLGTTDVALGVRVGRLLRGAGRAAEAIEPLRSTVASAPDSALAHAELAAALEATGREDAAIEVYRRSLELDAPSAEVRARTASLLFARANRSAEAGRAAAAEEDYRAVIRLAPDHGEAYFNLGTLCARGGRLEEAALHFTRAAELRPEHVPAHLGLAMALLLSDRAAEARDRLEASRARHPEDPALAHLLARVLGASSVAAVRDPGRAVNLSRELVERRPSAPHLETMAMALAAAGRLKEAVAWQERALAAALEAGPARDVESARRHLAVYREGRAVLDPWKE
jgi:tetratricopeptide (TPR) repeat protein